ncbi:MAG: hypothetical protein NZ826_07765 [Thermodesulfovibrio sp.]|nr:hypothetical protein [Thermodesulfovibrio sp.]
MKKILVLIMIFFFSFIYYPNLAFSQSQIQVSKDKVLQYAKPKKPLKIKLHRNKNGEYSWDITGENVEEIIKADKRLRQFLKEE